MQKSLLSTIIQTAGFAIIGSLFVIWYLGHQQNATPLEISAEEPGISRAEIGDTPRSNLKQPAYVESYANSNDYTGSGFKAPEPVTRTSESYRRSTTAQASLAPSISRSSSNATVQKASAVRAWKGVHRDESFAWLCFDRFGQEVVSLSEKHGLYPDVFMSRIIAYSYEFTSDPRVSPADNNFPGLSQPKNEERARFRSAEESLKAYAVVHAGEVKRLSREGALAKNDRAWTMHKIIDSYTFISNLASDLANRSEYQGRVGTANKTSEQESYQREMVGEAIKMVSKVDDIVKKHRAESAGYSDWEDYMDDLTEEERLQQEEEATTKTTALSKKKAFNLSRRVDAKTRKQN